MERRIVELRIGIQHSPRELSFETDQTVEEVQALVRGALENDVPVIEFTDDKHRSYLVSTKHFLYLEAGADQARRIGFIG